MAFTSLFKKLFTNSHNKLYTLNYLQLDHYYLFYYSKQKFYQIIFNAFPDLLNASTHLYTCY